MTDNKLKINCIGLGHWGPNLVRAIASHQNARVGTVCDLDQSRLELVQQNIPSIESISTDTHATLTDPSADAVVIATPTGTHFSLVKTALEAGKHVLVEKPLTLDVAEAESLAALAQSRGLILAVGHVFLFNSGVRAVYDYIQSGELGEIHYIFSTRTNLGPVRTDCNALWDLASHDLSIIDYWLGASPLCVTARGHAFLHEKIEDVVIATYTYPRNIMACIHASWLNLSKVRQISIIGQKKMILFDDMDIDAPVRIYSIAADKGTMTEYVDSFGNFRRGIRQGEVVIPRVAGGEPVANQLSHFIECVIHHKIPMNNATMAVRVVRELAAAENSMKNNSILTPINEPGSSTP